MASHHKVLDFRTKVAILNSARKLDGTNIYKNEDYWAGVRLARTPMLQNSQDMRKNASKFKLKHDTLTIDGVRYMWDTAKDAVVKVSAHSPSAHSATQHSASVHSSIAHSATTNQASSEIVSTNTN